MGASFFYVKSHNSALPALGQKIDINDRWTISLHLPRNFTFFCQLPEVHRSTLYSLGNLSTSSSER